MKLYLYKLCYLLDYCCDDESDEEGDFKADLSSLAIQLQEIKSFAPMVGGIWIPYFNAQGFIPYDLIGTVTCEDTAVFFPNVDLKWEQHERPYLYLPFKDASLARELFADYLAKRPDEYDRELIKETRHAEVYTRSTISPGGFEKWQVADMKSYSKAYARHMAKEKNA